MPTINLLITWTISTRISNSTCEKEENGKLAYLDVLVQKSSKGLTTGIYRKPTFTGQGLNWHSFSPSLYKFNSIRTLLNRAYDVCSNYFLLHDEICKLRDYFINNNYLNDTFNCVLKRFLHEKFHKVDVQISSVPNLIKYIKLPFYGHTSYKFRKHILKLLNDNFPAITFKIVFTNEFKIGNFFHHKDRIPDQLCSNIVYKFTCPGCQARYVGCSGRSFKIRMFEHMGWVLRV